jgi:tRNA(Arg) A34 adenosine deaminase TadA
VVGFGASGVGSLDLRSVTYGYDGAGAVAEPLVQGLPEPGPDQGVVEDRRSAVFLRGDYDDPSQLGRTPTSPSEYRSAPQTTRLAARADEIHGALDPIAQTRRTTAVMSTREGGDVLAGGVRDLTPAQRALARPGDVLGRLRGEHAEITALKAAGEAGLTPRGIATTTNICPTCRSALEQAGATITGPRSAWWW